MRASIIAASLGLALSTQAHLFIQSPTPIEGTAPKSPLDASGDNFPCHGVALPTSGGQTMAAGSQQLLEFDGGNGANTAVHGGGSCQISITYETDATAVKDPSNWHVIYSIEGGCPTNSLLNLDGTYTGPAGSYTGAYQCNDTAKTNGVDCLNQFQFDIPKGVNNGHAILAWTWFNNVGNREMYMNCVNTELTGGDGSEMDSFPSMFVANMADVDSCPTTAYQAVAFPNPGKYLTTKLAASSQSTTYPIATPTGPGCAGDGGSGSAASGSAAVTSASASSTSDAAATASSYAAAAPSSAPADVTVTTMATITGTSSAVAVAAPSVASTAPAPYAANSSTDAGSSTSGSCSDGSTACSTDGDVVCIGTSQWGLCNDGCAVPMALAAGTTCSGGTITKKRSLHGAGHVHKHVAGRVAF